jgi:hypothetical protein
MRPALCAGLLLLLTDLNGCRKSNAEKPMQEIPFPEPEPMATPEITMTKVVVHSAELILSASSKVPIKLWMDSNSWGGTAWRILRIRGGRVDTFYQSPMQAWTKNIPEFQTIGGDTRSEVTLDVNKGDWCSAGDGTPYFKHGIGGKTISFEPGDLLIAVYDIPVTREAVDRGVWFGVTATPVFRVR